MERVRSTTLYLVCGRIASGKSTLARRLAARPNTLLIAMDDWMSILFPTENRTIDDFSLLSARLRAAMGPHVVEILRQGLSVVLDSLQTPCAGVPGCGR
jgi:predicted kinase